MVEIIQLVVGYIGLGQQHIHVARQAAAGDNRATESPIEPEEADSIVRMKIHETKPLFVEDTVGRMNLVGHDFYFFLNAETERHCVVYRRKAGGFGLIQTNEEKMERSHGEGA